MRIQATHLRLAATVLCLGALLSACASGARTGAMTPTLTPGAIIEETSPLHSAIQVGNVTGGSETNPLWKSRVSDENFRTALEQALQLHTMAANGSPRYVLEAELLELDQPFGGFDLTVTAKVHYKLLTQDTRQVRLDETVVTPYTANFSTAFVAVERLRLANEGAMRENISAIIQKLVAASKSGSLAKG